MLLPKLSLSLVGVPISTGLLGAAGVRKRSGCILIGFHESVGFGVGVKGVMAGCRDELERLAETA